MITRIAFSIVSGTLGYLTGWGVAAAVAKEMAEAIGFKEASSEFEDDPEGAAQMEMSYWD